MPTAMGGNSAFADIQHLILRQELPIQSSRSRPTENDDQ
jgi:hypothetical protein